MRNAFSKLTPKGWFLWVIGSLIVLSTIYLTLHLVLPAGRSKAKLSTADVTIISSLLYEETATATPGLVPDGQRPLTPAQQQRVVNYIVDAYDLEPADSLAVVRWVALFKKPADLIRSLSDYIFPVPSYFWLYDGGLYVEVLFWTWFGLIASLLYSVSETLRKGTDAFDRNEVWVHIAKFLYAPLCSLVIFLGLSLAISDKSVIQRIDYSPNQILVAFIMGFFSGRLVQFLQNIKNLIFPDGTTNPVPTTGTAALPQSTTGLSADDIKRAIEQHGDGWRSQYPNVTGIAVQTKLTLAQPTGQLSALFEVTQKVPDMATGQIPALLPYLTPDGRQVGIPTDVVEVGTTRLAYSPGVSIHAAVPAFLGGSLRNQASPTTWGTLGLRLRDSQFDYVLSCYHVLCADLLAQHIWSFDGTRPMPVVVPGTGTTPTVIGDVIAGRFSQREDFALVRLNNPGQVSQLPNGFGTPFFDILSQPGSSHVGKTAHMIGAFSNFQQGKILAPYQEGEYQVPGLPIQTMKGLIKTERIASEGDSGAAVFIQDGNRNRVVGLLIGFNTEASYVLQISEFCTAFNVDIL